MSTNVNAQPKATEEQIEGVLASIHIDDGNYVSKYGSNQIGTDAHHEVMQQLEQSDIATLGRFMQDVLKESEAGKTQVRKRRGGIFALWDSLLGNDVMNEIAVMQSGPRMTSDMNQAEQVFQRLQGFAASADALEHQLRAEAQQVDAHVEAAARFLAENPDAGRPNPGQMEFLNQRERFERRINSLRTLYVSHLMSISQIRLAKAQAIDICDRFQEMRDVLLPIYRQHRLAMANKQFLDPEVSKLAIQAHENITRSIAQTLKGLPAPEATTTERKDAQ